MRKQYWDTRHFHHFLVESMHRPFEWGKHDCCLFAADALLAITDLDIADDFRGKYDSKFGAFKLIAKLTGGSTVADAAAYCAEKHGLVEHVHPLMAKRGDLVVTMSDGELIAGVIHLNGRDIVSVGEHGAVRIPICNPLGHSNIIRAWSLDLKKTTLAVDTSIPALPAPK